MLKLGLLFLVSVFFASGWLEMLSFLVLIMISVISFTPFKSYVGWAMSPVSMDLFSFLLVLMSLMVFFWANMAMVSSSKIYFYFSSWLMLFSLSFFLVKNFLWIYIIFELSVFPIFFIILGWGYQAERLPAALSLFFYTLSASMPLLLSILFMIKWGSFYSLQSACLFRSSGLVSMMGLMGLMAFLVKLPMYSVHMWLPKAHVEAPVGGSMVLAAVLLKLGGYGLILFSPLIMLKFNMIFVSLSLIGVVIISLMCLRSSDLKVVVAYSSVGHMGFVVYGILSGFKGGSSGSLLMLVGHGFTSSLLFLFAYYLYQETHSRSLMLNKGLLSSYSFATVMWFLTIAGNMAAPPALSFMSELILILAGLKLSLSLMMALVLGVVISSGYSLLMYSLVSHGKSLFKEKGLSLLQKLMASSHLFLIFFSPLVFVLYKVKK